MNLKKSAQINIRVSPYLRFFKKAFTDGIVPQGQLSDRANGKNEALTGGREVKSLSS